MANSTWQDYRRVKPFLRPYAWRLVPIILASLAATALGLAQPYISKILIDSALLRRDFRMLLWTAGMMFAATVLGFALNILSSYQYVRVSAAMLFDMRIALYRHLQTLSPRFFAKWRLGDLASRMNTDIGEVQRVSADTLLSILSNVVFLIGSVALMLWLNWRLFIVSVAMMPACLYVFYRYQQKLMGFTKELRERAADVGSTFIETLLGMRTVVAAGAGDREAQRFQNRNNAFVRTLLRLQMTSFLMGGLPGTILTASTAMVFLYGGKLVIDGHMTVGTLVAYMAYHMRLFTPVQTMMGLSANVAAARVSIQRVFEILDARAEVVESPNAVAMTPLRDSIRIEDVELTHDREMILKGAAFEIRAGSFCAILGASGAGKSTIADLLVRFLDPDAGRILYDGRDLREFRLNDVRREIMLVDQSPHLFHASISENIAYARPDASREEIDAAASQAGLDELIARLPEGLATITGERGLALSAGERQRIALARALLARPSVLILDEPTSALDAETETIVARHLRASLEGRTVVIITHRPALAAIADQIVTLREGKTSSQLISA